MGTLILTLQIGQMCDASGFLTTPPAAQLGLQQSDGVPQRLVFLLLFFPFVLPLFGRQLHVQNDCIFDCLCPVETEGESVTSSRS